jgi:hypothetical protein
LQHYRPYFIKVIKRDFPLQHQQIVAITEEHFTKIFPDIKFAATSKNPVDKRLDFCGYFLALIKTLEEEGEDFESIRRTCLAIVTGYVTPKNRMQKFLKRVPAKLIGTSLAKFFLKAFNKKVSRNENKDGFIANIITDKAATFWLGYGIDILECGICKLFAKHGYQKYASILCEVDEITSNLAGLKLVRTGTIANGADKCDFRFKKGD